jgi:hypothetical protein
MEEATENGQESSHSLRANGMNEYHVMLLSQFLIHNHKLSWQFYPLWRRLLGRTEKNGLWCAGVPEFHSMTNTGLLSNTTWYILELIAVLRPQKQVPWMVGMMTHKACHFLATVLFPTRPSDVSQLKVLDAGVSTACTFASTVWDDWRQNCGSRWEMWQGLIGGIVSVTSICMERAFSLTLQLPHLRRKSLHYTLDGRLIANR